MNQMPGHNCSIEEFHTYVFRPKYLTLPMIDLMSESTRKMHYDKALKRYKAKSLMLALMDKDFIFTDEQMTHLKEGE